MLFRSAFVVACSKNNSSGDCDSCSYSKVSGETDATVSSTIVGKYELTMHYANSTSPYPDGTKATFTISETELLVEISGKGCITLKNPVFTAPGATEVVFKDTCRDNMLYGVSRTSAGALNEINISTLTGTWLGQFKE